MINQPIRSPETCYQIALEYALNNPKKNVLVLDYECPQSEVVSKLLSLDNVGYFRSIEPLAYDAQVDMAVVTGSICERETGHRIRRLRCTGVPMENILVSTQPTQTFLDSVDALETI